ncbi:MAG: DNA double-strand break repair nuclease NurA [Candidatus Hadarchaeum sp.]|uniref:DNA double-strand break repair nuclease NurA n=1 Tax=Candidatus Hadarchaeum sp. TaxID=2883567 RepID=UPI003D0E79A4
MSSSEQAAGFSTEALSLELAVEKMVERIIDQESRRKKIGKALSGLKGACLDTDGGIVERTLVKEVKIDPLQDLRVCGVDGGLLDQQLHGFDLILVRALAVILHYCEGVLAGAEYLPSDFPQPRPIDVAESLDAWEFQILAGMERQLAEIEIAANVADNGGVGSILLDGSIVPQYVERFPRSPKLFERYQNLIQAYTRLYQACVQSGIILAGAVKDSRGARFVEILKQRILSKFDLGLEKDDFSILEKTRDTVLLNHLLKVGERTSAFTYAEKPASYVLSDLGPWATKIYGFYIRTVPFDRPLRVEFLEGGEGIAETADRVASLVYALSSFHDGFGLPSVIVEADARARLTEEDLELFRDSISARLEPDFALEMRRARKPF